MSPPKKTAVNDMTDLIVPVAIRSWLVFLLIFRFLGYTTFFSILFGAVAGFAAGTVSAWWQVKGGDPLPPKEPGTSEKGLIDQLPQLPRWRMQTERRDLRRRRRR